MVNRRSEFARLINSRNYKIGAEIGVFRGQFSMHLLTQCPQLTLFLVDSWNGSGMSRPYDPQIVYPKILAMRDQFGPSRVTIIRRKSPAAVLHPGVVNVQFDFIYIDADHSFDAVKSDINAWWPRVRLGGVLAGHDYNNRCRKRVKRAVDAIFPYVNVTQDSCASWWVEKSGSSSETAG